MNKYQHLSGDQLVDELFAHFQNLKHFLPKDKEELIKELYRNSRAYKGLADDIISVLAAMKAKRMVESLNEQNVSDDRILNRKIPIVLSGFNNNEPIKAKVDTGATMSSLDAQDIKIHRNQGLVEFTFGQHRVHMPVFDNQAVTSANNGMEYRPVVEFDVAIPSATEGQRERVLKKIKFNLSDRSNMPDKVLLGMNFIKAGDFVVVSDNKPEHATESHNVDKEARIHELYEQLLKSDISFTDLIHYIRKDAYRIYESLDV